MELKLRDGDYVKDGMGGLCRVSGTEELLQEVLFRLTAHRGAFVFLDSVGSRLWQLARLPEAQRQTAAEQFVAEALEEVGVRVDDVLLQPRENHRTELCVRMTHEGEPLLVTIEIQ